MSWLVVVSKVLLVGIGAVMAGAAIGVALWCGYWLHVGARGERR